MDHRVAEAAWGEVPGSGSEVDHEVNDAAVEVAVEGDGDDGANFHG